MGLKITLEFSDEDLQSLLDAAEFGDNPRQLGELTLDELKAFKADIADTAPHLVDEIVESAEDYCANDWLQGWGNDEEEPKMADFNWKESSYWIDNGKHNALLKKLQKLIPAMGECDDEDLEHLRQVQNAYHDLYNNGGGNRDAAILYFSGVDTSFGKDGGFHCWDADRFELLLDGHSQEECQPGLEKAMDHAILMAATEQGLLDDD